MRRSTVIVRVVAQLLLTPSVVVAVALIVKGYAEVGDGFSAGMVIALAIALQYVALGASSAEKALPMLRFGPVLALGGLLLALATVFFPLALGEPPVTHYPRPGQHVITVGALELFTPLEYDVAILLLVVGVMTVLLHQFARLEEEQEEIR